MVRDDEFLSLVDGIYSAALEPDRWREFVRELGIAFGDATVGFALRTPGLPLPPLVYGYHQSEAFRPVFERHYARGLPWGFFSERRFCEGFVPADALLPNSAVADTAFYREWMEPQEMLPEAPVSHVWAVYEGRPLAGVAIYRRVGCRAFTPDDLALGDRLVPHLSRAFEIHLELTRARNERDGLTESFDRLPMGLVLLDVMRRPVVTNRSARQILAAGDGVVLRDDGPHACHIREDRRLQGLLGDAEKHAAGVGEPGRITLMTVQRPSGRRALSVMVAPLLETARGGALRDAVTAIWLSDPDAVELTTTGSLEALYQLTPAEAELVRLLANGHSLEDAALRRGVTRNTARTQLKQVFAKMDTNRQGELVRLVLTGMAALGEDST